MYNIWPKTFKKYKTYEAKYVHYNQGLKPSREADKQMTWVSKTADKDFKILCMLKDLEKTQNEEGDGVFIKINRNSEKEPNGNCSTEKYIIFDIKNLLDTLYSRMPTEENNITE